MASSELNVISSIILISLVITLGYSLLIMIGGKNIFKKAAKKETTVFYPVINLFTLLEISEISIFFGILFFVPILNVLVLSYMFYKLGVIFNVNIFYRLGLVFLPFIFYPLLAFSNKPYKLNDQENFRLLENAKQENINLMTQEELDKLNQVNEEEPIVDSIFKGNVQVSNEVTPYKAVKIDLLGMEKLKDQKMDSKINNTNIQNDKKDNNEVEFLDL